MPHDAHDSLAKSMFSKVEYAADQFRIALPAEIAAHVDLAALKLCPGSFVSPDLHKRHADLLDTAPIAGEQAFLYLLLEHKSTVDCLMPYRMLRYLVNIWDAHLADHPGAIKLPVIIPMVLHHSDRRWAAPTALSELYEISPDVRAAFRVYLPELRFVLDDLSVEDDEELRARTIAGAVKLTRLILKKDWSRSNPQVWLRAWREVLREVAHTAGGVEALSKIARYILQYSETDPDSFRSLLIECAGDPAEDAFMTGAEQLVERGREQGQINTLRAMLTKQLRWRFDEVPADVIERIESANPAELERWAERFAKTATLDEIFSS